jgi:hypothetical protein
MIIAYLLATRQAYSPLFQLYLPFFQFQTMIGRLSATSNQEFKTIETEIDEFFSFDKAKLMIRMRRAK